MKINRSGLALLEMLMSALLVAFFALAGVHFFNQQIRFMKNFGQRNTCSIQLAGAMNQLKAKGLRRDAVFFEGSGTSILAPSQILDSGIPISTRSSLTQSNPPLIDYNAANNPPVTLRLPLLLNDSMGALTALYNSDPANYCQNQAGAPLVNNNFHFMPPLADINLKDFAVNMRIRPLNVLTGSAYAAGTCPSPLIPFPKGVPSQPGGSVQLGFHHNSNVPLFQVPPEYRQDVGWEVTLMGTYKPTPDTVETCTLTSNFQYSVDRGVAGKPVPHTVSTVTAAADFRSGAPSRPNCSHTDGVTPAEFEINIRFKDDNVISGRPAFEPGSVVLCRDLSQQIVGSWCTNAPGAAQTARSASAPATSPWVPCDRVTACGIPPSPASFNPGANYDQDSTYRLRYSNSDLWGCDVRIQYAAVDIAGNIQMESSEIMQRVFFQAAPCYSCVTRKRRGFFNGILCFAAVQLGVGQSGGCKGKSFTSCSNTGLGARTTCTAMQPPLPAWAPGAKQGCSAQNGVFQVVENGLTVAKAPWSLPQASHGQSAGTNWVSPNQTEQCEVQKLCDNGNWVDIVTPECSRIYTKLDTPIDNNPNPTTGTANCLVSTNWNNEIEDENGGPALPITTLPPVYDNMNFVWPYTEWYAPGIVPLPNGTDPPSCVLDP